MGETDGAIGVALIAVLVIAAVAAVGYFLPGASFRFTRDIPKRRVDHIFDPDRSTQLRGGARRGTGHSTWPLCRLDIDAEYVRATEVFRAPVWITRAECTGVREIKVPLTSGLLFETADGAFDGFAFLATRTKQALEALAQFGWPVDQLQT